VIVLPSASTADSAFGRGDQVARDVSRDQVLVSGWHLKHLLALIRLTPLPTDASRQGHAWR
jgi:hypothetical protein